MRIYEIDAALEALVDEETGEIGDYEAFEALQLERDAKIEGAACWVKNLAAEIEDFKTEEANLAKRRKVLERRKERLEKFLSWALDGQGFSSTRCEIKFRKSQRVEITSMAEAVNWLLSNGYDGIIQYAAPTVSKTDLKDVLKSGAPVEGAELVDNVTMGVK